MSVATDHEVRAGAPVGVLVEMPPHLDPLHGFAAVVAGRRGQRDQIRSVHGPTLSLFPKSIPVVLVDRSLGGRGVLQVAHKKSLAPWTRGTSPLDNQPIAPALRPAARPAL